MLALVAADRIERILVTDAHELAGIGAVRSLGRAGYRVTGFYSQKALAADGMPPALPPVMGSRYAAVVRAAGLYKTLLIWPYAVAPAVAGMLWLFMFNPAMGTLAYLLRSTGKDKELLEGVYGKDVLCVCKVNDKGAVCVCEMSKAS